MKKIYIILCLIVLTVPGAVFAAQVRDRVQARIEQRQERLIKILEKRSQPKALKERVQKAKDAKELKKIAQETRTEQRQKAIGVITARRDKIAAYLSALEKQGKDVKQARTLLDQASIKLGALKGATGADFKTNVAEIYQLFAAIAKTLK